MAVGKKKKRKSPHFKVDWKAIEREYRIGQMSIRAVAKKHVISESAVRKRAKKYAWERDLEDIYQRGIVAATIANDSGKSTHTKKEDAQCALLTDQELKVAVQVGLSVIKQHRTYLTNLSALGDKIQERLFKAFRDDEEEELITGEPLLKLPKSLAWVKGQYESAIDMVNKLTTVRKQTITLERQAYNLDANSDKKDTKNGDIEASIKQRMKKLKGGST